MTGNDSVRFVTPNTSARLNHAGSRRLLLLWFVLASLAFFSGCTTQSAEDDISKLLPDRTPDHELPKAAILATSDGNGLGTLCDGVVLAYEALNRSGIPTTVCDRTILSDRSRLADFDILIAGTLFGYHDADQRFSLTFIDDDQLGMLSEWIFNGGILVAGENFGRNSRDGYDRLVDAGELNPETWPLGNAIGVTLLEQNLNGFSLYMNSEDSGPAIWKDKEKYFFSEPTWALVPVVDVETTSIITLGEWRSTDVRIPAAWENQYGSGRMIYFSTFRLLHPNLDGGLASPEEIENFYQYLAAVTSPSDKISTINSISVSPWFEDRSAVLAVTLNCSGEDGNVESTVRSLLDDSPALTIFTNQPETVVGKIPTDLVSKVEVASMSRSDQRLDQIDLQKAKEMIHWPNSRTTLIKGFRFPRLSRSHQVFQYLESAGYAWDSSLPVNHQDYYGGSIYPVGLMLTNRGNSMSLNLLEMGPIFRDDWSFYGDVPGYKLEEAAMYQKFLLETWQNVFLPQRGLMVQIGDPKFEGESEVTLEPVKALIRQANADNGWIATLSTVADFWKMKEFAEIFVWQEDEEIQIHVSGGNHDLEGLTLTITFSEQRRSDRHDTAILGSILNESGTVVKLVSASGHQSFYTLQF